MRPVFLSGLSGRLLGVLARLWVGTLRFDWQGPKIPSGSVIVFHHGDQLALIGARPQGRLVVAVSSSRDGALQTRVLGVFGLEVVRGSSSRNGVRALKGLGRAILDGASVLIAVDGPRGPHGQVKPGALFLARRLSVPIFALAASARGHRLGRAWDRFLLPLPFSRVVVVCGEPIRVGRTEPMAEAIVRVEHALADLSKAAAIARGASA